jgi:hypothetical protein
MCWLVCALHCRLEPAGGWVPSGSAAGARQGCAGAGEPGCQGPGRPAKEGGGRWELHPCCCQAGFLQALLLVPVQLLRVHGLLVRSSRHSCSARAPAICNKRTLPPPPAGGAPPALRALPRSGSAPNDVKRQLKYKEAEDMRFADGDSRVSGATSAARGPGGQGGREAACGAGHQVKFTDS